MKKTVYFVALWWLAGAAEAAETVRESAREVPVARAADVLIVGGSSGAVAAAVAAKRAGADVYLIAPRPYLGEDMAGTLRLGLEDGEEPQGELEESLWLDRGTAVPFTYMIDCPSVEPHRDRTNTMLTDGKSDDLHSDAVQFNGTKAKVLAVMDEARYVEKVELTAYRIGWDFAVGSARLVTSEDGKTWSEVVPMKCVSGSHEVQTWTAELKRTVRMAGVAVFRRDGSKGILLGELTFLASADTARRRVPTPLQVKQTFDRALLTNGVDFLTGCLVTDVMRDASGAVRGVVMANRSGRQAVTAKVVIDATERATVARLAGVPFTDYPTDSEQTFTRVVVSSEEPHADGMRVRKLAGDCSVTVQWRDKKRVTGSRWECTLSIPMKDGSFVSFAAAEQIARDRTWTRGQLDAADMLWQVPPDRVCGATGNVIVLGGCAQECDAAGARLRPPALMRWGETVGRQAAEIARATRNLPQISQMTQMKGENKFEIREKLDGLRGEKKGVVRIGDKDVEVLGTYDVIVVGGGTAGAPAAIGAARAGAKTLLVEYLYGLGGVGTMGMIGSYWYGNRCGFTTEHDRNTDAMGALVRGCGKRECWRRDNRVAGTEIWFGAMACGAVMRGGRLAGVVVATPQGRGVVLARNVVDATGNADIADAAGAACSYLGDSTELTMQGAGLSEQRLGVTYANSDWGYVNDGDALDQWLFALRGRLGAGHVWNLTQVTNSRERRRVVGAVTVMPLDVVNRRTFPDTIVQGRSDFDTHGPSVDDICYVSEGVTSKIFTANLPYRSILPETLDGLAVVGLGVSVHRDAAPLLRMQPDVQNTGYAAGYAAALSAKQDKELRALDVKEIQRHLVDIGVIPEEVLTWRDNVTVDDERWEAAVRDMADGYKNSSLVLRDPVRALPALRDAYAKAETPRAKLIYAHVLGILGDATGAAMLAEQVAGTAPRILINTQGLPAFGRRMGEREGLMVALGRTKSPLALEPLAAEAAKLTADSPEPHVRAAPALEAALAQPCMGGWAREGAAAVTPSGGFCVSPEIDRCLCELNLARALLACGDPNGTARRIFEAYARDGRGVFALHAKRILEKVSQISTEN